MTNALEIPEHWTEATLGEIRTGNSGTIDPEEHPTETFELFSIPGYDENEPEIQKGSEIGSRKNVITPHSVLLSRINPRINRVWLVDDKGDYRQIGSTEWVIFEETSKIDERYLKYFLQSPEFRNYLQRNVSGVGGSLMRANRKSIDKYPIPIPPKNEQHIIVDKIEELFSKLDSGVSELEDTEQRLELYRRAVLKAAMEGEFTTEIRDSLSETGDGYLEDILEYRREKWDDKFQEVFKYSGKDYEEPDDANPPDNIDIPNKWAWGTINQISYVVGGLTKNSSKREEYSTEVPYLRVANVYAKELDLEEIKTIKISEREENTKMLEEGDLLIVEGNGSKSQIGRVALWDGSISPCSHQNHLIKVRILEETLRKFVLYWLLSPVGRTTIVDVASSTSGLHTLSISKVRSIPVPIPPAEEVNQIVQAIERRTTVADQVRNDVKGEVGRSERLRQSILKHAFEGKLVPQEPTEEPPTPDGGDTNLEQGAQATLSEVTSDVE